MAKLFLLAVLLHAAAAMPTTNRRTARRARNEYEFSTPSTVTARAAAPVDRRRAAVGAEQQQFEGAGASGDCVELTNTRQRIFDGCDEGIMPGRYMHRRSLSTRSKSDEDGNILAPPPFVYHQWDREYRQVDAHNVMERNHEHLRKPRAVIIEPFYKSFELFEANLRNEKIISKTNLVEMFAVKNLQQHIPENKFVFEESATIGEIRSGFGLPMNLETDLYLGVLPDTPLGSDWKIKDLLYEQMALGSADVETLSWTKDGWLYLFYIPRLLQPTHMPAHIRSEDSRPSNLMLPPEEASRRKELITSYNLEQANAHWREFASRSQLSLDTSVSDANLMLYKCAHYCRRGLPANMRFDIWSKFVFPDASIFQQNVLRARSLVQRHRQNRVPILEPEVIAIDGDKHRTANTPSWSRPRARIAGRGIHDDGLQAADMSTPDIFPDLLANALRLNCFMMSIPLRSEGRYQQGMNGQLAMIMIEEIMSYPDRRLPQTEFDVPPTSLILLQQLYSSYGWSWFFSVPKHLPRGVETDIGRMRPEPPYPTLRDFPLINLLTPVDRVPRASEGMAYELLRQENPVLAQHIYTLEEEYGYGKLKKTFINKMKMTSKAFKSIEN